MDDNANTDVTDDTKTLTDEQFNEPVRTDKTAEEIAAEEATAAAAAASRVTKDVVPREYRDRYVEGNGTCGDFIAGEISAITKDSGLPGILSIKAENGIEANRWSGLNNGMQRMNLANTIRASYLRGDPVMIGGKQHSLMAALEEFEGTGEDRMPIDLASDSEVSKFIKMIDMQDNAKTAAAIRKALGPKPEKKAVKTAEEKEAEKAAKAKEKADAKAAADQAKADAKAEKEKVAAAAKAEKDAVAADKAKVAAAAKSAKEKAAEAKAEKDAAKRVASTEANKAKADAEKAK